MRPYTRAALLVCGIALVAIQFVPAHRTNRLGAGDPDGPRNVQWILRRACYDCHSSETRWPIWAYIAPISWRVVADVDRARSRLNFSDWVAYDSAQRVSLRALVGPITSSHRMPLWYYVTVHPDARLSAADVATLQAWSQAASTATDPKK